MMKVAAVLIMACTVGGCVQDVSPGPRFISGVSAINDFSVPVKSLEERRFTSVVRQRYDFSCGSAALATLLHFHYGSPAGESKVFLGMWKDGDRAAIRRVGFSFLDMKRYLNGQGFQADGYKVTIEQIAEKGIPGVALISIRGYKHFVVVKGVTSTEVLLGDPSLGIRSVSRSDFGQMWNGVYFVVNSQQATGRASFNAPVQWAAFARAPIGARFSDPISLQALALTAPFYRDF